MVEQGCLKTRAEKYTLSSDKSALCQEPQGKPEGVYLTLSLFGSTAGLLLEAGETAWESSLTWPLLYTDNYR